MRDNGIVYIYLSDEGRLPEGRSLRCAFGKNKKEQIH